jgi:hypothetical protein
LISCIAFAPAHAASKSSGFTVSVMVEASCAIAVHALLSHPEAGSENQVCSPAASLTPGIPAPRPTVTVVHDDVFGRSIMTVEF